MALCDQPTYDLETIKALVKGGVYRITGQALAGMGELSFDPTDVEECVAELASSDFHKTMPSERVPGLFQDVYRPIHCGLELYVKLQLAPLRPRGEMAVVISFKRK